MKTARVRSKQDALTDELWKDGRDPKQILGQEALLKQLAKRLAERALQAEWTDHLGCEPNAAEGRGAESSRNGYGQKTLQGDTGPIPIEVPRDRDSSFEPQVRQEAPAAAGGLRRQGVGPFFACSEHPRHPGAA